MTGNRGQYILITLLLINDFKLAYKYNDSKLFYLIEDYTNVSSEHLIICKIINLVALEVNKDKY